MPPGRFCHIELTLKPGRRALTAFELEARLDATTRTRTERETADDFNAVVDRYRRNATADELRLALLPIGARLVRAVESWLPSRAGEVAFGGRLEGGKLESKFTLYRCVGKPPETEWKKVDEWSIELADERVEHIGELELPLRAGLSVELLVGQLAAFVGKVDVPEEEAPPETLPVPHP
jgi:hypothetical protein